MNNHCICFCLIDTVNDKSYAREKLSSFMDFDESWKFSLGTAALSMQMKQKPQSFSYIWMESSIPQSALLSLICGNLFL